MKHSQIVLLALLSIGPAEVIAQSAPEPAREAETLPSLPASVFAVQRLPIREVEGDLGPEVWAAGADYKVSFHDGMTFVPYLGAEYPVNQPVSWRTSSVRIGETELLVPGESPTHRRDEFRYEYRYGNVIEAYDVLEEGLEQSFVIPRRPASEGDLIVSGRLVSDLTTSDLPAACQSLDLVDAEGTCLVHYGRALAVDARGAALPLTTTTHDGTIHLTVPAAFVRDAAYPLVIDPLITRTMIDIGLNLFEKPDVVWDGQNREYMIAYIRRASSIDGDAYARIVDENLNNGVHVFWDPVMLRNTTTVAVASAGRPLKYVLANSFSRFMLSGGQDSRVAVHLHAGGDRTLKTGNPIVNSSPNFDDSRCDIGGTVDSSGSSVMLVYQRDRHFNPPTNTLTSVIMAQQINIQLASPAPGSPFVVQAVPNGISLPDTERPSINQVASVINPNRISWVVAFQQWNSGGPRSWSLVARQISNDGTQTSTFWTPQNQSGAGLHRFGAQVAGSFGKYGIAYTQDAVDPTNSHPDGIGGRVVAFERFDWPDGSVGNTIVRYAQVNHRNSTRRWQVGGCSFDYPSQSIWAFTLDNLESIVQIVKVGSNGQRLEEHALLAGLGVAGLAGGVDFAPATQRFTPVWEERVFPSGPVSLHAAHLIYNTPTPWSVAGASCSPATIEWTSSIGSMASRNTQQIGHGYTQVRVTGAPTSAVHVLLLATGTTNMSLNGIAPFEVGCRLLVPASGPQFLGSLLVVGGSDARWNIPLPEFLSPQTLYFQDVHLTTGGATLQTTGRLVVDIIK